MLKENAHSSLLGNYFSVLNVFHGLQDGERVARRGYWGDVINSPYLSFGIESEEKSFFEKKNNMHVKV